MNKKRKIFFILCLSVAMCASILPLFTSASSVDYYLPSNYNTTIEVSEDGYVAYNDNYLIKIVGTSSDGSKLFVNNYEFVIDRYAIYFDPSLFFKGESDDGSLVYVIASIQEGLFPNGTFGTIVLRDPQTNSTVAVSVNQIGLAKGFDDNGDEWYQIIVYSIDLEQELVIMITTTDNFLYYEGLQIPCININTVRLDASESIQFIENDIPYEFFRTFFDIPLPEYIEFTNEYKTDLTSLISTIIDSIQSMFANDTYASIVYIFMAFSVGAMALFIIFKFWR